MRSALNSPFTPGSDHVPEVWAGRVEQLSDWRDVVRPRRLAGLPERGRTILGEAGLGKSALVRRIAHDAAGRGDWVTPQLRVPSGADPLKLVAAAALTLADKAGLAISRENRIQALLGRVQAVAAGGISLSLRHRQGAEPYAALTGILIEIGRAAMRRGDVMVVLHIDEVQNITDDDALSQLLVALGDTLSHEEVITAPGGFPVQRTLPVAVYLTGLPDFADRTGAGKGATFARRFKTTTLTALTAADLAAALQPYVTGGWEVSDGQGSTSVIHLTPQAAQLIAELCQGEPFLFQLAGERAWYAGADDIITADHVLTGWETAKTEAAAHVERLLDRLPPRERDFVYAMAELPAEDRTATRISQALGLGKAAEAGPTARRLDTVRGIINRGKPYTFRNRAVGAYLTTGWPNVTARTVL